MHSFQQQYPAECGLACLAFIFNRVDQRVSLDALRRKEGSVVEGLSFAHLQQIALRYGTQAEGFKLALSDLGQLKLPSILHFSRGHFVVLLELSGRDVKVFDPAKGLVHMDWVTLESEFSGFALEFQHIEQIDWKSPTSTKSRRIISPKWYVLGFALLLTMSVSQLITLSFPIFVQSIVDQLIGFNNWHLASWLFYAFTGLLIVRYLLGLAADHLTVDVNAVISKYLGLKLFSHLLSIDRDFFRHREVGDIVSRFRSIDELRLLILQQVVPLLGDVLFLLLSVTLVMVIFPLYGLYIIPLVFLLVLYRYCVAVQSRKATLKSVESSSSEQTHLIESIQLIDSIKDNQLQLFSTKRWHRYYSEAVSHQVDAERLRLNAAHFYALIVGLELIVSMLSAAHLVGVGAMTLGQLFALMTYRAFLHERANSLAVSLSELAFIKLHLLRLKPISDQSPINKETLNAPSHGELNIDSLSFAYPRSDWIVHDLSARIQTGDFVQITGGSGAGKSTLLKLIGGQLEPNSGEVKTAKQSLHKLDAADVVAYVSPTSNLLRGTIKANICCFDKEMDPSRYAKAMNISGLEPILASLPMGDNTLVGPDTAFLSSGQLQRILIARAVYQAVPIMLFDEATSHLDEHSEAMIYQRILRAGYTLVAISHSSVLARFATVTIEMPTFKISRRSRKFANV